MNAVVYTTDPKSYVIDPAIDALSSTIWVNGSATISSGKYQINNTSLRTVPQFLYGEVDMKVTIPSAPSAGHDRVFGFVGVSVGNRGAFVFKITDDVFTAEAYSNDGSLLGSQIIEWNAAWTNTPISLIISHLDTNATFIVRTSAGAADEYAVSFNLTKKVLLETKIVEVANPLTIDNGTADNLLVSYIAFNDVQRVTSSESFAGIVPSDGTGIPVFVENGSPTYDVQYRVASATIAYVGEAAPGTATSASTWRIKRLDTSSGELILKWANGTADFDKVFDNRASYSYS